MHVDVHDSDELSNAIQRQAVSDSTLVGVLFIAS